MKRSISFMTALVMTVSMALYMPPLKAKALSSRIESAVQWAEGIANDNSHGYRLGAWGPEYDCGHLIIQALNVNGIYTGATYTGDMRETFVANGFKWIPWNEVGGVWNMQRGDIILSEADHTELYLGNGQFVVASDDWDGVAGDSGGEEIWIRGFWNRYWDGVLRYNAEDTIVPSKPSLTVSSGTATSKTTFSWNACSNADWYDVRVYKSDGTNIITTYNINGLSYSIDLPQGDYYATVHSVNSNGTYTGSDSVSFSVGLGLCEPKAVTSYNGHVYALYENLAYYDQAKELCNKMGGHLATITSNDENNAIGSLMSNAAKSQYWIGGTRVNSNSWKWETGENFSYSNWNSGEPNNCDNVENYIVMRKADKLWNDERSSGTNCFGFILEIDTLSISEIKEYNGHIYYRFDNAMNWTEANEYCKMLGGNLAVITSKEENEFIYDFIKSGKQSIYWLGLVDSEKTKTFKWVNDESLSYTNWDKPTQPDCYENAEFYGEMYKSNGKWNDNKNYTGRSEGFVCEINKNIKGINIKNPPNKTTYYLGDTIDLSGMSISVDYEVGESSIETSGFTANADMNAIGKQMATITYKGKTAEFEIEVKCPKPDISLISKTDSSVELSWREIPIASEYAIIVNGVEKIKTSDTSYTITGLNASTNYDIQVVAYEGTNKLETADTVSVSTARRITFRGTGTSDSPYLIGNADDLICLSEMINDKLTNVHFKNCYYRQTSDISLNGIEFEPIGNNTAFAGNYDGDHHIISGMNVNSSAGYAGLFGKVGEPDNPIKLSEISNLVVHGNVNSSDSYAGGIAGMISYNTNIYQCGFYGDITSTEDAGGIVGRIEKGGVISSCYHNGTVNGSTAGGIVGQIIKSTDAGYDSFIVSSYHHNGKANGTRSGGICGFIDYVDNSQGIVSLYNNFYEKGSATYGISNGESADAKAVNHTVISAIGETLGAPFKDHEDSSRNNGCPVFVWELPMYKFNGSGTQDNPYLIRNKEELVQLSEYLNDPVYNSMFNKASYQQTADIDLKGIAWKPMAGNRTAAFNGTYDGACHIISNLTVNNDHFGGLFGYISVGAVKNLVINNGSITAKTTAGGISAQLGNGAVISQCAYNGTVSADVAGGLVGEAFDGSSINSSYCNGNITGKTAAGGIVGSATFRGAKANNCYHGEGSIKAESAGGIAGISNTDTAITNSYYIKGSASGTTINSDGTAVSDKLMKSLSDTLESPFSDSNKYPVFSWLETADSTIIKGDINYDTTVSVADAVLLQRYLLGAYSMSEKQGKAADINSDNSVDVFDMVLMRRLLIKGGLKK